MLVRPRLLLRLEGLAPRSSCTKGEVRPDCRQACCFLRSLLAGVARRIQGSGAHLPVALREAHAALHIKGKGGPDLDVAAIIRHKSEPSGSPTGSLNCGDALHESERKGGHPSWRPCRRVEWERVEKQQIKKYSREEGLFDLTSQFSHFTQLFLRHLHTPVTDHNFFFMFTVPFQFFSNMKRPLTFHHGFSYLLVFAPCFFQN